MRIRQRTCINKSSSWIGSRCESSKRNEDENIMLDEW